MAIIEEAFTQHPESYISRDYNNAGNVRAVVGFRVVNGEGIPIICRITYQNAIVDWWTPLGRSGEIIQPGETVSATFNLAVGQSTQYTVGFGPA